MDATEISSLGTRLTQFLRRFADCFGRSEPREHLRTYIRGQLSNLPRKSVEPIALTAGTPPRTLQRFLESVQWDEQRLRDRQQQFVAREHAHPKAIGVVDESGNPKKGRHTAAVKRQWCGRTGKIDNCVMGVHLSYVAGDFQCLLDSDLFLPQDWANDPVRRAAAFIPDEVVYRKKTDIALAQIQRALSNGIRVAAWTCDEFYGRDGQLLEGLEAWGQNYVAEVPSTFTGWLQEPLVLLRPTPQEMRKTGRKRRFPRLARKTLPACAVRNLMTCSRVFQKQKWRAFRIKDGEKGPLVWEVKHAVFYRKRSDGLAGPAQCLIVVRNVLDRSEIKFFVSNLVPGSEGVALKWLLWVAFSRWPIERCFQQAKDELGMDHFEVRGWRGIHRHLYITQLSHLFCARERLKRREKKRPAPSP
jgi:SRSO17 transposase